jgi:hypothetical protein
MRIESLPIDALSQQPKLAGTFQQKLQLWPPVVGAGQRWQCILRNIVCAQRMLFKKRRKSLSGSYLKEDTLFLFEQLFYSLI